MKNNYRILQLILVASLMFNCQTEELVQSEEKGRPDAVDEINQNVGFKVKVLNDMLAFDTQDDLEKAIQYVGMLDEKDWNSFTSSLSFASLSSISNDQQLEEMGIKDRMNAVFLNTQQMFMVGNNAFQVNYLDDQVLVYDSAEISSKSSSSRKTKQVFGTEDDVFGLLDGSISMEENLAARSNRCSRNDVKRDVFVGQDKYEIKVVYQSGFPNRSLQAKIKRADGVQVVEETRIGLQTQPSTFFLKRKDGNNCDRRFNNQSAGGFGREYNLRIYYSSRALSAYDFNVSFWGSNTRGSLGTFLRIQCSSC